MEYQQCDRHIKVFYSKQFNYDTCILSLDFVPLHLVLIVKIARNWEGLTWQVPGVIFFCSTKTCSSYLKINFIQQRLHMKMDYLKVGDFDSMR